MCVCVCVCVAGGKVVVAGQIRIRCGALGLCVAILPLLVSPMRVLELHLHTRSVGGVRGSI